MIRLFNVSIAPATFILLIIETLLLTGSFLLAILVAGELDPVDYLLYDSGLIAVLLVVLSFLLGLHLQNLYAQIRVKSRVLLVQQLCMVTGAAFLAQGLISYLDNDLRVSVRVMLAGSAIAVPVIFAGRLWFGNVASQWIGQTRLVVIGCSPTLEQLRYWIGRHPQAGLLIEASAETPQQLQALDEVVHKQQPPKIIFAAGGRPDPKLTREIMELQLSGYEVETAATMYEKVCGRVSLYSLRPEQLIFSNAFASTPQRFFYREVLNVLVAGVCAIATMPVMLATALLLRATNGGNPFWTQPVMTGLNGQRFQLYRFQAHGQGWAARLVRKLRLEGLPQLWNVLRGDLAIVGPQPDRPEFLDAIERYLPFYRERYLIRPGMTGWAQTHRETQTGTEDVLARLELDLYYIKNMSLGLDTLILLHTLKSMLISLEPSADLRPGEQLSASS